MSNLSKNVKQTAENKYERKLEKAENLSFVMLGSRILLPTSQNLWDLSELTRKRCKNCASKGPALSLSAAGVIFGGERPPYSLKHGRRSARPMACEPREDGIISRSCQLVTRSHRTLPPFSEADRRRHLHTACGAPALPLERATPSQPRNYVPLVSAPDFATIVIAPLCASVSSYSSFIGRIFSVRDRVSLSLFLSLFFFR